VHELVACVSRLLEETWGEHPIFGRGTINVGQIAGGVAANVVADSARAEILVRTVEPPEVVESRLRQALGEHVSLQGRAKSYGPIEFHTPDDSTYIVAFATDAPHLTRWGDKLLYGPGRILDAHTDHECLSVESFERAVGEYVRTIRGLLERG
jgi:acetylornithine deacetylase